MFIFDHKDTSMEKSRSIRETSSVIFCFISHLYISYGDCLTAEQSWCHPRVEADCSDLQIAFMTGSSLRGRRAPLKWNLSGGTPGKSNFPIRSASTRAADADSLNLRNGLRFTSRVCYAWRGPGLGGQSLCGSISRLALLYLIMRELHREA